MVKKKLIYVSSPYTGAVVEGQVYELLEYYKDDKRICCGYTLKICTYLSKEQNELIQKYFIDKYNIKWNVVHADGYKDDSQWMLRCGTIEGRKFLNLIRDYVLKNVPSMSYKVIDI